ncbi:MAG: Lipid A core--O-antigen ligase-like protein [Rhodocyclaceae bacterium]|nr:MAG: Lipid A core--O-antigen ligase-like protein [Rhodocyclaceae bacterium]TND01854.1 MAG: Lipid A core--O-antigen ligase-like protein [Rhodocyclaceae bacterium]
MPIAGFWSEWWAGALGLAAAMAGLIAVRGRSLILPLVLLVPAVLLLTLLLQFGLGRLVFPQLGLLYAVYLLWAGVLMVLGRYLVETTGLVRLADVIASALLLGALVGAGIALAQWLGVARGAGWIFPKLGGTVYANLGQANHHAQYSWLGIASLFYLCSRRYLSRPWLWILILLIAFGSVLSGSRSVFVYPLVLLAAIGWLKFRRPQGPEVRLWADAVLLLPAVIALSIFAAWATSHIPDASGAAVSGSRLYESVSGSSTRLEIARSAWAAFLEHPWLGQGVGNYAWASFVAASSYVGDEPFGVAENAHNFILHLMTEFGAPATGAVILLLGIWARCFLGKPWGLEQFWCGAVLGIGLVHALLEYPLWYSYFLGPTALLLGAADRGGTITLAGRRLTVYLVLAALGGGLILANLRSDYIKIEAASNFPLAAHPDRERAWRISMDRLVKLHHESLLSPWVLLAFTNLAEPSKLQAQDRADLCERGIHFAPARLLVARCAMQQALAGRDQDARALTLAVLRAFPAQRSATVDELAKGAREFPEIAPLWELSLGKY